MIEDRYYRALLWDFVLDRIFMIVLNLLAYLKALDVIFSSIIGFLYLSYLPLAEFPLLGLTVVKTLVE